MVKSGKCQARPESNGFRASDLRLWVARRDGPACGLGERSQTRRGLRTGCEVRPIPPERSGGRPLEGAHGRGSELIRRSKGATLNPALVQRSQGHVQGRPADVGWVALAVVTVVWPYRAERT